MAACKELAVLYTDACTDEAELLEDKKNGMGGGFICDKLVAGAVTAAEAILDTDTLAATATVLDSETEALACDARMDIVALTLLAKAPLARVVAAEDVVVFPTVEETDVLFAVAEDIADIAA